MSLFIAMKKTSVCCIMIISLFMHSFSSERLPTLALLTIEDQGLNHMEMKLIINVLRNDLVNAGVWQVLDRENMDKVLREQSLNSYGIVSDQDAIRLGRLLNVEKIMVGSIMNLGDEYFMELRIIDVATSTIEKSRTDRCASPEDLPDMIHRLISRMSGVAISAITGTGNPDASTVEPPRDITADDADTRFYRINPRTDSAIAYNDSAAHRAAVFRMLGFTSGDHRRFRESLLDEKEWASREEKIPVVAGLLGTLPVASGFYYTNSPGQATFITLAKIACVVGMLPLQEKGSEDARMKAVFPVALIVVTIADIAGSTWSALDYNKKLGLLSRTRGVATLGRNGLGAGMAISF